MRNAGRPTARSAATANAIDSASAVAPRAADQLDAGLDELVLPSGPRRLVAEDAADVAQPQRFRLVVQAGAHHARGGDGHIGAEGQGAAVAVEEAVHLRVEPRADVGGQRGRVLEGRQDDLPIAPRGPGGAQAGRHAPQRGRVGEQEIAHPLGERTVD